MMLMSPMLFQLIVIVENDSGARHDVDEVIVALTLGGFKWDAVDPVYWSVSLSAVDCQDGEIDDVGGCLCRR